MLGLDLSASRGDGALVSPVPDLDLYSCKIVGWQVHDSDHSNHAVHLVRRTAQADDIAALVNKPVMQGDNVSTL